MAICDILAVVDTGDRDEAFVRDAIAFAEFHRARLTFLILSVIPSPDYAVTFGPPYIVLKDLIGAVEAKEARLAQRSSGQNIEIRTISDLHGATITQTAVHARYADLVLFGPEAAYDHAPVRLHAIEGILFASGRPVLLLPHDYRARAIDHVAIGWNATREATHALKDMVSIAAPGARVDILVAGGRSSAIGHGSEPGADVAHHLARHGFVTTLFALEEPGLNDSELLVRAAQREDADLLALGAYGHSRMRQMILGGVTRDLLKGSTIPVLFSH